METSDYLCGRKFLFMKRLIFILLTFSLLYSCKDYRQEKCVVEGNRYSQNFGIVATDDGYDVTLTRNNRVLHLSREKSDSTIQIPIHSAVCFSTTHTAFISQLGEASSITGLSGTEYVCDPVVVKMIRDGKIKEIGYDKQLDMERIISLKPDVVFAYGIDNESISGFQKLERIGIPIVIVDDYLEPRPLGRTEWMKFFGCFYDKLELAEHYFDSVENRYNEIKAMPTDKSPKVLVSLPWKGTWWVPGGNSFFANFVKEAGGQYVFDNESTESLPYSIEQVFLMASDAEVWLNTNEKTKRSQILDVDSRLENLAPYKNARIYNNNKITSEYGGSDFWESGIVHPDIILQDLRKIFTEDDDSLHYYRRLE